jgi:hypothetical protein
MPSTEASDITLEDLLQPLATWSRKERSDKTIAYMLKPPGRGALWLSAADICRIDPRLPPVLEATLKKGQSSGLRTGFLTKANLELWHRYPKPALGNNVVRESLGYLYELFEVSGIDKSSVRLLGNFLEVDTKTRPYPVVTGVESHVQKRFSAEVFNAAYPGGVQFLDMLAGMGYSPTEMAGQLHGLAPTYALPLHLPTL